LLKWGAFLRLGALRAIETDETHRLRSNGCRIARFGTIQCGFQVMQALFRYWPCLKISRRNAHTDIIGEEAAHNLLMLQDQLPPADLVYAQIDTNLNRLLYCSIYVDSRSRRSIGAHHRARTTDGKDVAIRSPGPGIREHNLAAISNL
jgi:ubiquinone biosynthesis protein